MKHHSNKDSICPLCSQKLEQAHPYLRSWFERVKSRHPSVHISCSYRGKADQDAAFKSGKSELPFPYSKHNFEIDGKPCSLALDLFVLDDAGQAHFPPKFYAKINAENEEDSARIRWGGSFKSFFDGPHFEALESVLLGPSSSVAERLCLAG